MTSKTDIRIVILKWKFVMLFEIETKSITLDS